MVALALALYPVRKKLGLGLATGHWQGTPAPAPTSRTIILSLYHVSNLSRLHFRNNPIFSLFFRSSSFGEKQQQQQPCCLLRVHCPCAAFEPRRGQIQLLGFSVRENGRDVTRIGVLGFNNTKRSERSTQHCN